MTRPAVVFPIALALGAVILAPTAGAREEGPIEIEKCQTISQPGSYKLVNNLTFKGPPGGICLSITASFDLAGFAITNAHPDDPGNPSGTAGIFAADDHGRGITVRNGSISGGFTRGGGSASSSWRYASARRRPCSWKPRSCWRRAGHPAVGVCAGSRSRPRRMQGPSWAGSPSPCDGGRAGRLRAALRPQPARLRRRLSNGAARDRPCCPGGVRAHAACAPLRWCKDGARIRDGRERRREELP